METEKIEHFRCEDHRRVGLAFESHSHLLEVVAAAAAAAAVADHDNHKRQEEAREREHEQAADSFVEDNQHAEADSSGDDPAQLRELEECHGHHRA